MRWRKRCIPPVVKTRMKTLLCCRISYLQEYLDCQEDQEDPKGGHETHLINISSNDLFGSGLFVKRKQKPYLHLSHLGHFLLLTLWDPLVQGAQGGLERIFQAEIRDS